MRILLCPQAAIAEDADGTIITSTDSETVHYHYGPKDLVTILFYIFITIILHAVVQEYILDKISKRLHLSKVKHSKFNESGQLVVFHLTSVIWCFYVVVTVSHSQDCCSGRAQTNGRFQLWDSSSPLNIFNRHGDQGTMESSGDPQLDSS
ncbi:hypothetical protein P7K49_008128 [Saguinus oedipus]|uniref:TRAM1-like protein domain-containing protein n=1 Tax=Saguinus oedipus TaxID=9490 RepID=A0ABQ9VWY9_SAGOE|nr:hypothetical protein P7K49_008128 [Saguinus oedipus]